MTDKRTGLTCALAQKKKPDTETICKHAENYFNKICKCQKLLEVIEHSPRNQEHAG